MLTRKHVRAGLRSKMGADVSILVLSQVGALAVSLALTPFQLRAMGQEAYGVLAVTTALLGSLTFFDIGVGWALTHFVPYYREAGEEDYLRRLIFAALLVSVTVGLAGLGCLWFLAPWAAGLFKLRPEIVGSATFAIRMAAIAFPVVLTTSVMAGIGRGLGLFAQNGLLRFANFAILNVAWAIFAHSGRGVELVSLTQVVLAFVALGVWVALITSRFPERLTMPTFDSALYRKLLSYGFYSSVTSFGYLLLLAADKLILAALVPVQNLVFYSIPFTVASQIPVLSITVALVLFPRFSASAAVRSSGMASTARSETIANKSRGMLTLFNGATVLISVLLAPLALRIWLGPEFARQATLPFQALSIGFGIMALGSVDQVYLQAHGRVRTSAGIFVVSGMSGIASLMVVVPNYGIAGASIAIGGALAFIGIANLFVGRKVRHEVARAASDLQKGSR